MPTQPQQTRQSLRESLPDGTGITEIAMQLHGENRGSSEDTTPEWRRLARSWIGAWCDTWQPSRRNDEREVDDAVRSFLVAVAGEKHWTEKGVANA